MRILLVPSSYEPVLGGLQTAVGMLARGLKAKGHEVMVLTQRYPRTLKPRETIDGIEVRRVLFLKPDLRWLKAGRIDIFLTSLFLYPVTCFSLRRIFKQFQPDVVNVHFAGDQVPFILQLKKMKSFKLVLSFHGDDIERFSNPHRQASREALSEVVKSSDAVTACSRYLLEELIRLEPSALSKGTAVLNGIHLERFEKQESFRHSKPYILAFGRFTFKKGFDLLIQAFALAAGEHPEVDLILAGDGEERETLRKLAQDAGLRTRVIFYGKASGDEMVKLLNGCLSVIIPSRSEPFGIAALEALAAGKFILATRVGGLAEIVGPPNLLVEPTVEGLTKGILQVMGAGLILKEVQEKNLLQARQYTAEKMCSQYEALYH